MVHDPVGIPTYPVYVPVLAHFQKPTVIPFLTRAIPWLNRPASTPRLMSVNRTTYLLGESQGLPRFGASANRTRLYSPGTKGKVVASFILSDRHWFLPSPFNYLGPQTYSKVVNSFC